MCVRLGGGLKESFHSCCNSPSTRGNWFLWDPDQKVKKRKDMGQIYTAELNGETSYLWEEGHRGTTILHPDEGKTAPFCLKWARRQADSPDIMWTEGAQITFDGGWKATSWGSLSFLWCNPGGRLDVENIWVDTEVWAREAAWLRMLLTSSSHDLEWID